MYEQHVWRAVLQKVEHMLNENMLILKRESGLPALAADCKETFTDGVLIGWEGMLVEHEKKENTSSIA